MLARFALFRAVIEALERIELSSEKSASAWQAVERSAVGLFAGATFVFLVGQTTSTTLLLFAMTVFGFCKGFYDSGIFASLFDSIEPRARGTAAGIMNTVGWGGGALGPLFVGLASKYGGKPTEVENMSDAIAFGGVIYLIGAALIGFAIFSFRKSSLGRQTD